MLVVWCARQAASSRRAPAAPVQAPSSSLYKSPSSHLYKPHHHTCTRPIITPVQGPSSHLYKPHHHTCTSPIIIPVQAPSSHLYKPHHHTCTSPIITPVQGPIITPVQAPIIIPVQAPSSHLYKLHHHTCTSLIITPLQAPIITPVQAPIAVPARGPTVVPARGPAVAPMRPTPFRVCVHKSGLPSPDSLVLKLHADFRVPHCCQQFRPCAEAETWVHSLSVPWALDRSPKGLPGLSGGSAEVGHVSVYGCVSGPAPSPNS